MITIQKAEEIDLESLRLCVISAFIDEEMNKPVIAKSGGPPGYDLIESHVEWLKNHDYFKCIFRDQIIGGSIVKKHPNHYELFGIFLSGEFIGKGIGSKLLQGVMKLYPIPSEWVLETPDYSIRNHRFYERNGFKINKQTQKDPNLGYGFMVYTNIIQQKTT